MSDIIDIKLTKAQCRKLAGLDYLVAISPQPGAVFGQFNPPAGTMRAQFFPPAVARELQKVIAKWYKTQRKGGRQ